jgi:hypothetical protein
MFTLAIFYGFDAGGFHWICGFDAGGFHWIYGFDVQYFP